MSVTRKQQIATNCERTQEHHADVQSPEWHSVNRQPLNLSCQGIIARSLAAQRPRDIASVITLGSPFRGTVAHETILKAAEMVRKRITCRAADQVLPQCYTGRCSCEFLNALKCTLPDKLVETAIFTRNDGVVDWRYCLTGDASRDFEVSGTHLGLTFNAAVYSIIASRLALALQTGLEDGAEQLLCA